MAATAGAIKAGRAYVEIFADSSPLVRGLKLALGRLKAFGSAITSIGLGVLGARSIYDNLIAPIMRAGNLFNTVGSQLNDLSQQTGASASSLSAFAYAAQQTGIEIEDVATGMNKVQKLLAEAKQGSAGAADTLKRLGLSAAQLATMKPEDQILAITDALNRMTNVGDKNAMMMEIFGRGGAKMAGFAKEVRGLTAEARRLGLVMSDEDVAAADTLGDAMGTLGAMFKSIAINIGAALAPTLVDLAGILRDCLVPIIAWVKENRALVVIAAGVAVGVLAASAAIFGLGVVLSSLATILGAVLAVLAVVNAAFLFLLSPIGLVLVAIAAATTAFLKFTTTGQKTVTGIMSAFAKMRTFIGQTLSAIADALAAGDIEAAANILWTTLVSIWARGVLKLNMFWVSWRDFFEDTFSDVVAFLRNAWLTFTNFFRDSFSKAIRGVVDGMAGIIELLGKLPGGLKVIGLDIDIEKMRKNADALGSNEADDAKQRAKIESDRVAGRDARDAASQAELDKFGDAANAAEFARQKAVGKGSRFPGKKGVGVPSGIVPNVSPLADAKLSTVGTFSSNLRGLGTGDQVQKDQLKQLIAIATGVNKLKPPKVI